MKKSQKLKKQADDAWTNGEAQEYDVVEKKYLEILEMAEAASKKGQYGLCGAVWQVQCFC